MSLDLSKPVFCFTCDIDWNQDDCIKTELDLFEQYNVKVTVFSTHQTDIFAKYQNLQIGIHPNFLPGSTHGRSIDEVIEHMFTLYPNAETFRSHSYYDSQYLTEMMVARGIKYDSNLCLYLQENIIPLHTGHGIIRFPVFFEDSIHWYHKRGWNFADLREQILTPGLKIFNFHPYPVALNIPSQEYYHSKRGIARTITANDIPEHRYLGEGPQTFLEDLLEFVTENYETYFLKELYRLYTSY